MLYGGKIRVICLNYRLYSISENGMTGIPIIDLFAGAGGLGLGATMAGGTLKASFEIDPIACETLKKNSDGEIIEGDLTAFNGDDLRRLAGLNKKDPLVIVGGPPCQPFSKAAYWTESGEESRYRKARAKGVKVKKPPKKTEARPDERRSLVQEFWRLIKESDADAFLFENVPSILHPRNVAVFNKLKECAELEGYKIAWQKSLAVEYGVPQKRERVFLAGMQHDTPSFTAATHHKQPNRNTTKLPAMTSGKALKPFSGIKYHEPEEVVEGKWAEHLKTVPPGMNYKAHTAWSGHPNPAFVTETRFWNFLLKLSPNLPSWTIAASPGPWTGPFHWESRRLRTPELAALQSFPIGYKFQGSRRERVKQIGNAVPPLLAKKMLEKTIAKINGH